MAAPDNTGNPSGSSSSAPTPYVFLSLLLEVILSLLLFGAIYLNGIFSSLLLVYMTSLVPTFMIMNYLLFLWIKIYKKLLIFSTPPSHGRPWPLHEGSLLVYIQEV